LYRNDSVNSSRYCRIHQRYGHYLTQANPIRQPKDLVTCILNNIVHQDEQFIVFNKPPGVMVLGKLFFVKSAIYFIYLNEFRRNMGSKS